MGIAAKAIRWKTFTLVLTAFMALGGLLAYAGLGRLEDPDFTIKRAVVLTAYPGASPVEVEQEVTDRLETAIQRMGQVDEVSSISRAGSSVIFR